MTTDANQPTKTAGSQARHNNDVKRGVIIALGIVALLSVGGCAAYLALNQAPETIVEAGSSTVTLGEGETKIKSGGTYNITGSTTNGQLEIDTSEDVKVILSSVSITNPQGAAIKVKDSGNTTLEFVGENTLAATGSGDNSAAAISAEYGLTIAGKDGSVKIASSGKGIKAEDTLHLESGTFDIAATDDAIHSNDSIEILDGNYTISTGDDAIHADADLTIADGVIDITKSHEGLEAVNIEIAGGDISVVADDDGINAQNSDGSSVPMRTGDGKLAIAGGKVYVNSQGDGLDSNGAIEISGGEVYVDGPTNSANAAVDCDGEIVISGGTLVAVGASGMAQNATSATQPSVLISLGSNYSGEFSFGDITYSPAKSYQSVLVSSASLKVGETYSLKIAGKEVKSVTVSQNIVGQGNAMGGPGGAGRPGEAGGANGGRPSDTGAGGTGKPGGAGANSNAMRGR